MHEAASPLAAPPDHGLRRRRKGLRVGRVSPSSRAEVHQLFGRQAGDRGGDGEIPREQLERLSGPHYAEDLLAQRADHDAHRPPGHHQGARGRPAEGRRGHPRPDDQALHRQPRLHHPGGVPGELGHRQLGGHQARAAGGPRGRPHARRHHQGRHHGRGDGRARLPPREAGAHPQARLRGGGEPVADGHQQEHPCGRRAPGGAGMVRVLDEGEAVLCRHCGWDLRHACPRAPCQQPPQGPHPEARPKPLIVAQISGTRGPGGARQARPVRHQQPRLGLGDSPPRGRAI
mmetsp:Transcript_16406/g.38940  ORF Transcript_16406/g.38940 Transcript_16406/m.38940 type:complete len:288 (+) Transcript_16406:322-1185(+)